MLPMALMVSASTAHLFNCLDDIDGSSDTQYTQASRITLTHPLSPNPLIVLPPLCVRVLCILYLFRCIFRPIARLLIKDERCESCAMRSAVKFIKIATGKQQQQQQ